MVVGAVWSFVVVVLGGGGGGANGEGAVAWAYGGVGFTAVLA